MKALLSRWLKANRVILANASSLMSSQILTSAVGFVYWWLAARQFPLEAVGLASAAVSAMALIGTASALGLGTLLIGELPRQPGRAASLISTALCAVGATGTLAGLVFAILAPWLSPDLTPLAAGAGNMALFAVGVGLTTMSLVVDHALIGLLRGDLQLWRNILFAVIKLLLLVVAGFWLPGRVGLLILATWVLGSSAALLFLGIVAWRNGGLRQDYRPTLALLRHLGRPALGHHALNVTTQIPGLALPVLVTAELSATANAHFYIAWMIASLLFVAPYALTTVLYAVGSAAPAALAHRLRQSLILAFGACGLAVGAVWIGADLILGLFGPSYAEAGLSLRLLALGVLPLVVRNHYVALSRLQKRVQRAALLQAGCSIMELVLAATGGAVGGLVGLTVAWLVAVTFEAVIMAPMVYRAALGTVPAAPPVRAEAAKPARSG